MNTTEVQQAISARFDYSGSTIPTTSTEWSRRLVLINQAESIWRHINTGRWSVLLTTTTLSTTPGQSYIQLPSGFDKGSSTIAASGYVTINGVNYQLVEYDEKLNRSTTNNLVWITGNPASGYKLNIQPTPTDTHNVELSYYTHDTATDSTGVTEKSGLTEATDLTKIPDAYFLVDWVVGELYLIDDEPQAKWGPYKQSADTRLRDMLLADIGEQNQITQIKLASEESGFDVFNSYGSD